MDEDDDTPARDRLDAVTFEGSALLGGSVRIELGPGVTVLVGRNAAGKSLLLESLDAATDTGEVPGSAPLGIVKYELSLGGVRVDYVCQEFWEPAEDESTAQRWREHCTRGGDELWRVEAGVVTFLDGRTMMIPVSAGLFHVGDNPRFPLPPEVARVRRLLYGVNLIPAGVPRTSLQRRPLRLFRHGRRWRPERHGRLADSLAVLVGWHERHGELYDTVVEVSQRLQILSTMEVRIADLEAPENRPDLATQTAEVLVDGVDFACLSDGTLRVMEIVIRSVNPATTVLLLEEPETGIHPGLLHRLLAELEAYAREKQIVFSTHAPGLLNWAKPEDVRLVERTDGVTSVRRLTEEELRRVRIYLDDDLGLSDFVFSGALG